MKYLREIVDTMGFDVENLSSITGIDTKTLARYLDAEADPDLRELKLIAAALNLSISDIISWEKSQNVNLLFRANENNNNEVLAANKIVRQVYNSVEILEKRSKPKWLNAFGPLEETYEEAERLANLFRKRFCKDDINRPLYDLPELLSYSADILLFVLDKVKIDGASGIYGGWPFICISKRFQPRMLFTLAHELGHIVSHHNDVGATFFDPENSVGAIRGRKDRTTEAFADAFASFLLLPTNAVGIALQEIRKVLAIQADHIGDVEILYLAYFFGVSFEAAAYRCEQLDLLPSGGAASLYDYLVKEHKSPEKRAAEIGLPKRVEINFDVKHKQLLEKSIERVENGEISLGMASEVLGQKVADIMGIHARNLH